MFSTKARARRASILIIPLAVLCSVVACSQQSTNNSEPTPVHTQPPSTAFPMPPIGNNGRIADLGWTLADGQRVSLSQLRGKVVVLDLYATWCEPCRRSIPHLINLHERFEAKGLALVGLNVGGPDDRIKVASFAAEFRISYPLGFPDKQLTDFLLSDNSSIPQTFVFDHDGQLIKRYIGYDDSMPGQLETLIQTELDSDSRRIDY